MTAGSATPSRTTFVAYSEAAIDELYYLATEHANKEVGAGKEAYNVKVGAKGVPLVGDESRQSWPSTYKVRDKKHCRAEVRRLDRGAAARFGGEAVASGRTACAAIHFQRSGNGCHRGGHGTTTDPQPPSPDLVATSGLVVQVVVVTVVAHVVHPRRDEKGGRT
jgi:hypothetical protein